MADFVQTMKDWRRMCRYYDAKYSMQACDHCPLEACLAIYDDGGVEDYAGKEKKIGEWAAEHPEPVYPTWGEWLNEMGVVGLEPSPRYEENYQMVHFCKLKIDSPIPADIAQKLGIEPKEGTC